MGALPFLVEWGHVISKLVVGGSAGLALLGYREWRNRRDVRPAREDAHRMGLSINEPREGPIAILAIHRAAGDERWLECGRERISLAAELAIVRGSGAIWKHGKRTYTLRDGDIVLALGTMSRAAGTEATDYREAAGGWQLGPSAGEPAIAVCIAKPVPCPRPLWPVRGLLVLGLVGVCAYVGLGYLGHELVAVREYPREEYVGDNDVSTFAAEVASALPRHRDEALDRFAIDLEYKPRTEHVLDQLIALARMRGCFDAVDLMQRFQRYDEAIETAADCDRPEYARSSLIILGRYDEAAVLPEVHESPYRDNRLVALIGAGRWSEAAAYVDAREDGDPDGDPCIARYLRSLAGAKAASAGASTSTACLIVDGPLADQDFEKADPLVRRALVIAQWAFAGGPPNFIDHERLASWFAPHVRDASQYTHALRANLAMDLGRFDEAASEIEKALAALGSTGEPRIRVAIERQMRFSLALRTGKQIEAFELDPEYTGPLEEAASIRSGSDARQLPKLSSHGDRATSAFVSAAMGSGLLLAQAVEANQRGLNLDTDYLLAVAPMIKEHREELARALRNRQRSGSGTPPLIVRELAIDRDLARLLGDRAEAERLQAIIDRHAKAFGDPARLKALLLANLYRR